MSLCPYSLQAAYFGYRQNHGRLVEPSINEYDYLMLFSLYATRKFIFYFFIKLNSIFKKFIFLITVIACSILKVDFRNNFYRVTLC